MARVGGATLKASASGRGVTGRQAIDDARREVPKGAGEPAVLEVGEAESLSTVGVQEAHGVGSAQAGEQVVLAWCRLRMTPVEQRRDATVTVDQDVVWEQVVMADDLRQRRGHK